MERRQAVAQARFRDGVEWVRAGTIFAQSDKQYRRWRSSQLTAGQPVGLTGAALEKAVTRMSGATVVRETISPAAWAKHQAALAAVEFVPHPAGLVK